MGGDTSLNVQNVMISPKEFPRPTSTHIYLHSNEYKLSITECIELFMCQMFHPSWCQVPGCHTTGHTGCGECDANVLLIRYLHNNIYNYNIQNSPQPRRDADGGAVMMEEYFLRKQFHISRIPPE